jgi:hypothetical protein
MPRAAAVPTTIDRRTDVRRVEASAPASAPAATSALNIP